MDSGANSGASAGVLHLLSLLSSGGITVTIARYPVISVDSSKKELGVEIQGAREAGLALADLLKMAVPGAGMVRGTESVARQLAELGWTLTLYDRGKRVLSLGSGASRLTGHVSVNPLNLKGLADAMK